MLGRASFVSVSTLAMLAAASAGRTADADPQAGAQAGSQTTANTQDGGELADIVISATRQSTNLQHTPIAITAVTSQQLVDRGITNLGDLSTMVPNSQILPVQGAFGPGVSAFIRGIGSGDTSLGGESQVAFYIDDVYYPLLLAANFDLVDTDHVEVLRGPQGTLFGRNALAGAINIVAKQPSLTDTTGYADFTTGAFERRDMRAGFNLPLGDEVALMVSVMSKSREGFVDMLNYTCEMETRGTPALAGHLPLSNALLGSAPNFTPGNCVDGHLGGQDVQGGRASLLWQAAPRLKMTFTTDYTHDTSENTADTAVAINPALANANTKSEAAYFGLPLTSALITGSPYATYANYSDPISAGTVIPGNTFYNGTVVNGRPTRGGYDIPPHEDDISWGVSSKLVYNLFDDIDLTWIMAYRSLHDIHTYDTQALPIMIEDTENDITENYLNSELRLSGRSTIVDWVAGLFYYDGNGTQHALDIAQDLGALHTIYTTYAPDTKAAFANATLHPFGNQWSLELGARYSKDRKFVNFSNLVDVTPSSSDIRFQVEPHESIASWKAGLNYQMNDSTLFYTSAATGNSLPGYNARPLQPDQVEQFDGDKDIAYELGTKLDFFDRRVRLNADVFYTDFSNRTETLGGAEALINTNTGLPLVGNQQLIPLQGGPAGSTTCSTVPVAANTGIVCIGRSYYVNKPATVRGVELEYTISPFDGLVINGSTGWSKFISPDIEAEQYNKRQTNPFWTANAGIQYTWAFAPIGGSITPRIDWTYEDSQIVSGTSIAYNDLLPAHSQFNARISYDNDKENFQIALGATNLFNHFYWINVFDYQGLGYPETMAQPAAPREWYLTLTKRF
ncbi:MAG TPA: TonB-dependent receptor [Steroidobacteraceae bacterium]|nr:TonB-dependent receptor [Steroidobacteraceae bacterium]